MLLLLLLLPPFIHICLPSFTFTCSQWPTLVCLLLSTHSCLPALVCLLLFSCSHLPALIHVHLPFTHCCCIHLFAFSHPHLHLSIFAFGCWCWCCSYHHCHYLPTFVAVAAIVAAVCCVMVLCSYCRV